MFRLGPDQSGIGKPWSKNREQNPPKLGIYKPLNPYYWSIWSKLTRRPKQLGPDQSGIGTVWFINPRLRWGLRPNSRPSFPYSRLIWSNLILDSGQDTVIVEWEPIPEAHPSNMQLVIHAARRSPEKSSRRKNDQKVTRHQILHFNFYSRNPYREKTTYRIGSPNRPHCFLTRFPIFYPRTPQTSMLKHHQISKSENNRALTLKFRGSQGESLNLRNSRGLLGEPMR